MKRAALASLAQETLSILETGIYTSPSGKLISISDNLANSIAGTCEYEPSENIAIEIQERSSKTVIEVCNETTLVGVQRLIAKGYEPVALNFASAKNPGGGFSNGARAQEESLARSSGLYACLVHRKMYKHHRMLSDAMYTHWAIYSPKVPVFRTDEGPLLEEPYLCSMITSPAVNSNVVLQRRTANQKRICEVMRERIRRVLTIAYKHQHKALVLGAWGCGVFGNDPTNIAELFFQAINTEFQKAFEHIVFSIFDTSQEQKCIKPFHEYFIKISY